ncbi:C25 family cysteine peptidase [Bacteroidota bacterium]
MKFKLYLLTLLFVFSYGLIFSQDKSSTIEYSEISKGKAEIKFELGNYSEKIVKTNLGLAVIYSIEDGSKLKIKSAPDLPKVSKSIIIPDKKDIEIVVKNKEYFEIEDVLIAPSKGVISREKNPADIPFEFGEIYNQNIFFPEEMAELGDPYILRDFRGQVIEFNPFQYNPVNKVLRIYTSITLEVLEKEATINSKNIFSKSKESKITKEFNEIYKNHFLNYNVNTKYTSLEEDGDMLIVSPEEYISALDTFIQWKKQRGLHVELVEYSTIGSSDTEIKTYIDSYYNENELTYLLIIGDAEDVPSLTKSGDSDAAYGHILGDDSYAEVFVGRFSAESIEEVETQVARTIYYERDIDETATWLSKGIGIASDEGGGGQGDDDESDIQHMDNIRTDLLNYGYNPVDQIYDPGATPSDVSQSVNEGRAIINYVGHGSDYSWATSGFNRDNVNALTNENMLPFIFDVACVNGNFHGQTCFAESWMRATNNSNPTGAVAIVASTINQSWSSPMDGQDEMVNLVVESYENNVKRTFGGVTVNGCMHMIDEYGSDGSDMTNTWTIFGDPSLLIRTKTPQEMSISHNPIIFVGATEFNVDGDDSCFVSLTLNDEIIATAQIVGGSAALSFEALPTVDTLIVTVTGYNKITYQAQVLIVVPDAPYIVKTESSLNDDAGNSNQEADFGESIALNVKLKNISEDYDAFGVETKLRSTDTNFILIDTLENFGDLAGSSDSLINNAYSFNLNHKIIDQYRIPLQLVISGQDENADPYEWNSKFNITINAPNLKILEYFIDDQEQNDNGILDPGETTNLKLIVQNTGHASLGNITGLAEYVNGSSYFELVDSVVAPFTLDAGKIDTINFIVSVDQQEQINTSVTLKFSLIDTDNDFYSVEESKEITIGEIPECLISEEGTVTLNTEKLYFYDSGGEEAEYSGSENYTITFVPKNDNEIIKIKFLHFDVEDDSYSGGCYDYLTVYNGASTSDALIGEYCNENPPTEIMASNETGALTFSFYSDGYVELTGWKAEISSESAHQVKFVISDNNGLLENAKVEFNNTESFTNSNGEVVFSVAKGDNIPYSVSKDGYEEIDSTITVDQDELIELSMQAITYHVTFSVQDGESTALQNVFVEFNNESKYTDASGECIFDLNYCTGENYNISMDGYNNKNGSIDVHSDTTLNITMTLTTYIVTFVVVDPGSSVIQGVTIEFNDEIKYTDHEGKALFVSVLPGNDLEFNLSKSGYWNYDSTLNVSNDDVIFNAQLSSTTNIQSVLKENLKIYPNPSNGLFMMEFTGEVNDTYHIEIYDLVGSMVYSKEIKGKLLINEQIDISDKAKGMYLISIKCNEEFVISQRLILK